jgi:hypothetical protein
VVIFLAGRTSFVIVSGTSLSAAGSSAGDGAIGSLTPPVRFNASGLNLV